MPSLVLIEDKKSTLNIDHTEVKRSYFNLSVKSMTNLLAGDIKENFPPKNEMNPLDSP